MLRQIARPQSKNEFILGIYGAGGFGREVMPFVKDYLSQATQINAHGRGQIYFVETNPNKEEVNGVPLLSENEFFALECNERFFNVAIGDTRDRERIANHCIRNGAKPFSIQSPHSIIYNNNDIREGAIICAYSMVTSNAKIGRFFHSNIYSYVAHDCIVGDFVTFAPRVHCNGHVHVHNYAYIGTCAVIREGTSAEPIIIGEGAIVGMGAVVTKNVPPHTTVVGNPARPLSQHRLNRT